MDKRIGIGGTKIYNGIGEMKNDRHKNIHGSRKK
jgi:hypothetical protein